MAERHSLAASLAGIAVAIGGLTVAVWGSARGWPYLRVFLAVSVSWGGYLLAHRGETGRVVDEPGTGERPSLPDSRSRLLGALAAGAVMALAFPLGVRALVVGSFPLLAIAATGFVGGYAAGHRLLTGTAL